MTLRHLALTGAAWGALALTPRAADAQGDFHWKGPIAPGKRLEIKGVNGYIRATVASGDQAEVSARRHARRSDPASVEIKVVTHDAGVTICAVYPTPEDARRPNECAPGRGAAGAGPRPAERARGGPRLRTGPGPPAAAAGQLLPGR